MAVSDYYLESVAAGRRFQQQNKSWAGYDVVKYQKIIYHNEFGEIKLQALANIMKNRYDWVVSFNLATKVGLDMML